MKVMVQHGSTGSTYAGFNQPWKLHACIQWLGGRYGVYGCIHGSFILNGELMNDSTVSLQDL